MKRRKILLVLLVVSFLTLAAAARADTSKWLPQRLPSPYEGQYTGIAATDLNNDGYPDLLISAGKHWVDQPYVLMNLGSTGDGHVRWSDPLPIGPPAGYYAIDAGRFSFLTRHNAWGVLLAGGDCNTPEWNQFGSCVPGTSSPALLLEVSLRGCSVWRPNTPCDLEWDIVWQDASHQGDRNGALAYELGNGVDPAIILTGSGGVSVFEPPYSEQWPTFTISPEEQLPETNDLINRGSGLAVGRIGTKYTGFFIGTRTTAAAPPAPLVGVWKTGDAKYSWYTMLENNEYFGDPERTAVQATGIALADLNGDGIMDVIEANHLNSANKKNGVSLQQDYALMDEDGNPTQVTTFSWEAGGGRTVNAGSLFSDSDLPDVVLGTSEGQVVLFVNLGNDDQGNFLGLQERHRFTTMPKCEVRHVVVVPNLVRPCAPSIAAVVYCPLQLDSGGVFLFHNTAATCPTAEPTDMPTPAPTREPTPQSTGRRTPKPTEPTRPLINVPAPLLDDVGADSEETRGDPLSSAAAVDLISPSWMMFLLPLWLGMMTWPW